MCKTHQNHPKFDVLRRLRRAGTVNIMRGLSESAFVGGSLEGALKVHTEYF
jgi:hypothetical protein